MAHFTVRNQLRQIVEIYRTGSAKVAKLYAEYKACDDQFRATFSSKQLSAVGKQKERERLDQRKVELKKEMQAIREQTRKDAEHVKTVLSQCFYAKCHPTEDGIDERTIQLIGILTPAELIKKAEHADVTTKRFIGKELEKKGGYEKEARALLASTDDPHLRLADELIGIGDYSVGGAPLSGFAAAKQFNRVLDKLCDPIIEAAPRWALDIDYHSRESFGVDND